MVALLDSMGISKTFNVADIFSYYPSEEPMYPDVPVNSRSSFSQVGETNAKHMALDYIESGTGADKTKLASQANSVERFSRSGRPNPVQCLTAVAKIHSLQRIGTSLSSL